LEVQRWNEAEDTGGEHDAENEEIKSDTLIGHGLQS
jgi:hypothetical protein